jgi:hypothetical protein
VGLSGGSVAVDEYDRPRLTIVPMTIKEASGYVRQWHRHHTPPRGGLFAAAVAREGGVCGVAVVGRPVARMLQDGWTAEITRVATDGTPNACGALYGAIVRVARMLGYRRLITYTLPSESGSSLKGAAWRNAGPAGGGSWSRRSRARADPNPTDEKIRWEANI